MDTAPSLPPGIKPDQILAEIRRRIQQNKLRSHRPYGHPETLCPDGELWKELHAEGAWEKWSNHGWQLDFHNAGKDNPERMAMAANGVGKSISGALEVSIHATGVYPDWWEGIRFGRPVESWACTITNELQRAQIQPLLLGDNLSEAYGTGFIPKDKLVGKPRLRQAGIPDVVDSVFVRHVSGELSSIYFRVYKQGWRIFQAGKPDIVWLDEQPDESRVDEEGIWSEVQTRVFRSNGIIMATLTPLLGETDLIRHFLYPKAKGIYWVGATWDDAPHLNEEQKERLRATYPHHESEARTKGIPMMGEGRVFSCPEEDITIEDFPIPNHWAQIKGIDFGIDHPAAVADIAWDRENDMFYVTRTWKKEGCDVVEHAEAIKHDNQWVPVSWPHDGVNREKGTIGSRKLKDLYVTEGVRMLGKSARYDRKVGGAQPVEPVVQELERRMMDGSFKVFRTCKEFFEEYRSLHRKDGKIVARRDDVMKAIFYGYMMKTYGVPKNLSTMRRREEPAMAIASSAL